MQKMQKILFIVMIINIVYSFASCANFLFGKKDVLPTSENDIKKLIENASNVYGWFELFPLKLNHDYVVVYNNQNWYKVANEKYDTFYKLDDYLCTIFSRDIVNKLWTTKKYRVFNNNLYSLSSGRKKNSFIKNIKYKSRGRTKKRILYQATVTYTSQAKIKNNKQKFDFTYEKINGRWIFTEFSYFY